VLHDAVEERGEGTCVAKGAGMDGVENGGKGWVELVVLVEMRMAEVVDIFGEVAKEEDILLSDFTGDFNLTNLAS
jgi:hypothetical protein